MKKIFLSLIILGLIFTGCSYNSSSVSSAEIEKILTDIQSQITRDENGIFYLNHEVDKNDNSPKAQTVRKVKAYLQQVNHDLQSSNQRDAEIEFSLSLTGSHGLETTQGCEHQCIRLGGIGGGIIIYACKWVCPRGGGGGGGR